MTAGTVIGLGDPGQGGVPVASGQRSRRRASHAAAIDGQASLVGGDQTARRRGTGPRRRR